MDISNTFKHKENKHFNLVKKSHIQDYLKEV